MEHHWQDFDHDLTQEVVTFVDNLPSDFRNLADQLRQAILKRVSIPLASILNINIYI